MGMGTAVGRLAVVAEAQGGLVTTRQAEIHDVPRRDLARLVDVGGLERVAHGVYRLSGAPRPRLLELRAAWLQLAPGLEVDQRGVADGVVSHVSAAVAHGVGFLESFRYEFTIPAPRRVRTRRPDVSIHNGRISDDEVAWVDEILVTTPLRTISDLCLVVTDGEHLAGVVHDALTKHMVSRRELAGTLAPYAEQYGGSPGNGRELLSYLLSFAP